MKKHRILCLVLTLAMVFSILPVPASAAGAADFTDISKDSWYYDYVEFVITNGYFLGTTTTTFKPNRTMTRAMFVVVLSRLAEAEVDNSTTAFSDVPADPWCAGAVKWASENGIVNGYSDGTFRPSAPVTREQMCAFMDRFINYYSEKTGETHVQDGEAVVFADEAQISAYAKTAVDNCQAYGLVQGYSNGYFYPQNNSTRAHVAAVISRLAWLVSGGTSGIAPVVATSYTITYDPGYEGAETFTDKTETTTSASKSFTVNNTTTREDYLLASWKDDEGNLYVPGETYETTSNLTLTAQWLADKDYIGQAVYNAMQQASDSYATTAFLLGASATVDPAAFNAEITPDDTRSQSVSASAVISDNFAETLITTASSYACQFLGSELSIEGVKDTVNGIIDVVEELLGCKISEVTKEQISNTVYQAVVDEGKSLWANFYDASGNYYTGNVTIAVGGKTYTVKVDQSSRTTSFVGDKKTAVKEIGVALAKDMYASLKNVTVESYNVTLSATVTFTFTDNTAYEANGEVTPAYPHIYPVELGLTLDGGDLISYQYTNNQSVVTLHLTEGVQNTYAAELDNVIKAALANETVVGELNDWVLTALKNNNVIKSLGEAYDDSIPEGDTETEKFESLLNTAVANWVTANIGTDPAPSGGAYYLPYEFFWDDEGTVILRETEDEDGNTVSTYVLLKNDGTNATKQILGNNEALYGLIEELSDGVADSIIEQTRKTVSESEEYSKVWDKLDKATQNGFIWGGIKTLLEEEEYSNIPKSARTYLINLCGQKLEQPSVHR